MKTTALTTIAAALLATTAFAHERITIGPKGGRVIYLDSTAIPNAEVIVNKEGRAEITLLDKDRNPIAPAEHEVVVTAGPRASAAKLKIEKHGSGFISEKIPDGAPYVMIVQIKESPSAKAITGRLTYNPKPATGGKPTYLDDSVNDGSGPSVKVPDSLDGLWAEINGHHGELKENFNEKKYEALDEVTQAFPVLLKALPAKSGDKQAAVAPQVEALIQDIADIAEANAARTLADAKAKVEAVNKGIAALKKHYPEKTANAKL
jgi:hypothetical protein